MMEKLFGNKRNLLILTTIFLASIYIVLFIYFKLNPPVPKLISASPVNLSKNNALEKMPTFEFDKAIDLSDIAITSSPAISWTLSQTRATNITATHIPDFQPATTYTISMTWKNRPLTNIEFTTLTAQVDPKLLQEMKDELARDYPLGRFTPYKTANYRVVYSSPMTFEITLSNTNLTKDDAIVEVRAWVNRIGGNPDDHKYTVISP